MLTALMLRAAATQAAPSPQFPVSAEIRAYLDILRQLLNAVAWPIAIVVILRLFREVIAGASIEAAK
jgi:hypothetical protein